MGLIEMLKSLQPLPAEDCMPEMRDVPLGVSPTHRSAPLGPKQLQWCRDNLGNFQKYEQQVLASKGEQAEMSGRRG